MSTDHREREFLQRVKNALDAGNDNLDAATRARLRAARAHALQTPARAGHAWLWPAGGVALAGVALLSWALWLHVPATHAPAALEQLELLSSADSLELYSDLEFYQWLASDNDAG